MARVLFAFISVLPIISPIASLTPALILTPLISQNRTEEARNVSLVNPSLFLNVTSHSGFLTVDDRYDSNTFFWYFPVSGKPVNETPWIVWLQGGPGASSLAGLFDEIGPFVYDNELKLRETSWSKTHSVVFIDNPIGAGYSFTNSHKGFATSMDMYSDHLYRALEQFLKIFPELQNADLYIAGESYAGRYIPALAEKIFISSKQPKHTHINLQGLIMGNPVLNREHIANYSSVFYNWGLIDAQDVLAIKPLQDEYIEAVKDGKNENASNLYSVLFEKLQDSAFQKQKFNILVDDYNLKGFETFLKRDNVREAMHVGHIDFTFSNYTAQQKLINDFIAEVESKVVMLLDHYTILIYCGQLDLTTPCAPSSESRRRDWQWSRRKDFLKAPRVPWWFNESVAGYVKSGGGLTEVLVRGAGHLVPVDKPAQASELISYFIRGLDLPHPPNYISGFVPPDLVDDVPLIQEGSKASSNKAGLIASVVINVVLVLILIVGVYLYVRLKRKSEAFFYSSVDVVSDDIFLS